MIKRKSINDLIKFFSESKKALLVEGARQIGKTFAIRQAGKAVFENFVEINFVEQPEMATAVNSAKDTADLMMRLSVMTGEKLVPGKTLIFFDEVQECPEIVTFIKFLVDEGSYRYVLSGSLFGVELNDLRSVPVGYMDILSMYPLDIEEFVRALGVADNVMEHIRSCWESGQPVNEVVHKRMMQLVRLYLIVGGMPAVVMRYLETNNLQDVLDEQKAILALYEKDIAKYDTYNKLYIKEIFRMIPAELNAENKRFILKRLNENLKFDRYENSFLWLKNAGVALPTYNVDEPAVPLLLARARNLFKLFQSDVGLLAAQYSDGIQLRILNDASDVNFGAVYENMVAQELQAHGFDLYYYNSKKFGELDFVVEYNEKVLPIEVKSGKNYWRHRALNNILDCGNYDLPRALVLCNDNLYVEGNITYAPIYMTMFLHRHESLGEFIYRPELP